MGNRIIVQNTADETGLFVYTKNGRDEDSFVSYNTLPCTVATEGLNSRATFNIEHGQLQDMLTYAYQEGERRYAMRLAATLKSVTSGLVLP